MIWLHRIVVTYMVATTLHVPFPVFDGDNLKSGETRLTTLISTNDAYDLDFILLGCDPPDDSDDGPIDDDPEDGSQFAFGQLFTAPKFTASGSASEGDLHKCLYAWNDTPLIDGVTVVGLRDEIPFRYFSFGKLCQIGIARLRC